MCELLTPAPARSLSSMSGSYPRAAGACANAGSGTRPHGRDAQPPAPAPATSARSLAGNRDPLARRPRSHLLALHVEDDADEPLGGAGLVAARRSARSLPGILYVAVDELVGQGAGAFFHRLFVTRTPNT